MGDEMPDLSLKLPNLTADISWSRRTRDSIDGGGGGGGGKEDEEGGLQGLSRCDARAWRSGSAFAFVVVVAAVVVRKREEEREWCLGSVRGGERWSGVGKREANI